MKQEKSAETKTPVEGWFFPLILLLLTATAVWLGLRHWLPPLASEHGAHIDMMIHYLLITTGAIFVVGHVSLALFIWRFSRQGRVSFRLPAPKAEWAWSLIPVLLMTLVAEGGDFVLGLPVWRDLYTRPAPADAVAVEVTGEQFAWNIRYPGKDGVFGRTDPHLITLDNPLGLDRKDAAAKDDIVLLNEIHLPVNRPARILLRSKDVLHSFFLPDLRVKQDLVPGMTIQIWFVPTHTGKYELACAELCGFGHFQMRGLLYVMSKQEFHRWLDRQIPFF